MPYRDEIDWDQLIRDEDVESNEQNLEVEQMRREGKSHNEIFQYLMSKQAKAVRDQEIEDLQKIHPSGLTGQEVLDLLEEQQRMIDEFNTTGDIKTSRTVN